MTKRSVPARGRPSKLTPELTEALCEHLRAGLTVGAACALAGISPNTFMSWCRIANQSRVKLEAGETLTHRERNALEFLCQVEAAEAEAERFFTEVIRKAAENNPEYARWWLATRRRHYYNPLPTAAGEQRVEIVLRFEDADSRRPVTTLTPETSRLPPPLDET